jgi:hypothetical protein
MRPGICNRIAGSVSDGFEELLVLFTDTIGGDVQQVHRPHMGSILNQILGPIQRFPQCLKSVRIVAFAFFLDSGVPKSAYR